VKSCKLVRFCFDPSVSWCQTELDDACLFGIHLQAGMPPSSYTYNALIYMSWPAACRTSHRIYTRDVKTCLLTLANCTMWTGSPCFDDDGDTTGKKEELRKKESARGVSIQTAVSPYRPVLIDMLFEFITCNSQTAYTEDVSAIVICVPCVCVCVCVCVCSVVFKPCAKSIVLWLTVAYCI